MSDLAEALATRTLTPFGVKDVIRAGIEIPGAAGGLREAMKFEPVELDHDQEVYVVLHCRVNKVRFDEIKDTDALARVHVLQVVDGGGALIEPSLVKEHLDAQNERIRIAREEAKGIKRLDLGDEGDEADAAETLVLQHRQGVHDGEARDGCPMCDEASAVEAQTDVDNADGAGAEPTDITTAKGARKRAPRASK
jgi:hypothetical protein